MNKKTIITILLLFVAMAGLAKQKTTVSTSRPIVWENPAIGYSDIPYFQIQKVELTKERTALHVRMSLMPGLGFFLKSTCYLQANGKQYESIGSDSIKLDDKRIVLDDTGKKDFVLYFKPMPMDTKEFDFIDGLTDKDYQVFCIHDKDYVMPVTPVPAEFLIDDADEELAEMKYEATPATIHFKSINYRKGMNTRIQIQYVDLKNPATFMMDNYMILNDDGEATVSLPIGVPQIIQLCIDNLPFTSYAYAYLAPGKEVTFLIDMLHDDTGANSKFVGIKGYFAKFNKDRYQVLIDNSAGDYAQLPSIALKDIHDVQTLMRYYDEERENYKKWINKSTYCKAVKQWLTQYSYDLGYGLNDELDSLAHTKKFKDYLLRNYTRNLYDKNLLLTQGFVRASKYYSMIDARGFNADLARYCYYLPQALDSKPVEKPLIEDKDLSDLYDKYVAETQKTTAANKEGLPDNAHYLDMTDIAPDSILQTILDRYKGKTILIDIWATWCVPCMQGHEKMKPLKEELRDKDIVYVYLTSTTSKYDKWKDYITDISGEHYFLAQAQLDGIFQQLNKNSYPTYAIFAPNGERAASFSGFNLEAIREALEKALNK